MTVELLFWYFNIRKELIIMILSTVSGMLNEPEIIYSPEGSTNRNKISHKTQKYEQKHKQTQNTHNKHITHKQNKHTNKTNTQTDNKYTLQTHKQTENKKSKWFYDWIVFTVEKRLIFSKKKQISSNKFWNSFFEIIIFNYWKYFESLEKKLRFMMQQNKF